MKLISAELEICRVRCSAKKFQFTPKTPKFSPAYGRLFSHQNFDGFSVRVFNLHSEGFWIYTRQIFSLHSKDSIYTRRIFNLHSTDFQFTHDRFSVYTRRIQFTLDGFSIYTRQFSIYTRHALDEFPNCTRHFQFTGGRFSIYIDAFPVYIRHIFNLLLMDFNLHSAVF